MSGWRLGFMALCWPGRVAQAAEVGVATPRWRAKVSDLIATLGLDVSIPSRLHAEARLPGLHPGDFPGAYTLNISGSSGTVSRSVQISSTVQ